MKVTSKGSSKDSFSVAVWNNGKFSYSASSSVKFTLISIKQLIESIK